MDKKDLRNIKFNTVTELYLKYKEFINYIIFGVLSTLVNFISYFLFAKVIRIEEITSNVLSWICSVTFAYITNKIFVFKTNTNKRKEFFKEMVSFFLSRILSGILCDVGTFALMVKVLKINDIISKIITQVMVIITNYILSKWIVFKKTNTNKG